MDVLGGLSSNSDSSFLTFKTADQAWYIGNEVLDFTYMQLERTAFNQILGLFWNDLHGKAPALPTVKFEKSERITVGKGNSSELTFSWVDFKPRKAEFVIPEWANDDAPVKAVVEAESKISNDDIPF